MTLRESLGDDEQRIRERIDALLDREDAVLVLFDGARVMTFAEGFGVSASQLESLGVELERALRSAVGMQSSINRARRRNRERNQSLRHGDRIGSDRDERVGHVFQLARKIA